MKFILLLLSLLNCATCLKYYQENIHNFGNFNPIHSYFAKPFTNFLDTHIYKMNVRKKLFNLYSENDSVIDLGCGVGLSTPPLKNAIGVDISNNMILQAEKNFPEKHFEIANIENFYPDEAFDYAQLSFVFHEIPQEKRKKIIERVKQYTKIGIFIMDISDTYTPSRSMISGEPFIKNYLEEINNDLKDFYKFNLIKDRVVIWALLKNI